MSISFLVNFFLIYRYTTDGGTRDTLTKGTIRGDTVFSGKNNVVICISFI